MLNIYDITGGTITNRKFVGLKEILTISTIYYNAPKEITLFANTYIGSELQSTIYYYSLTNTSMQCAYVDTTLANITLIGCLLELRQWTFFEPTNQIIDTDNNLIKVDVTTQEEGNFTLILSDLIGNIVETISFNKTTKNLDHRTFYFRSDIASGTYFITLTSPNYLISRQFL